MPDGKSIYLQNIFEGWAGDIHHILKATQEHEIEQRDLYDRPPSVRKAWTDGPVALLGDAVHAMMPNLGQGGCQAIEDAFVIVDELEQCKTRNDIAGALRRYRDRRLVRSAAVQGLSRFASDIIIRGFDTPAKIVKGEDGGIKFENFNYAGIVTSILRPLLPIFFAIQFAFLYDGWKNEDQIDARATFGFLTVGGLILLVGAGSVGEAGLALGPLLAGLFGSEGLISGSEGLLGSKGLQGVFDSFSGMF
jgi:zeaxanthin epoxidase